MTKLEKFLFNQNIFDEPAEEEEIITEAPPPPTFSEEELEQARRTAYDQAYQKGREEAAEETKNSRGQMIANVLQKISVDTGLLFAAESERDTIFEQEVVRVCHTLFKKLFPIFLEKYGEEEMRSVLKEILQTQEGKSEVLIETSPEAAEGVQAFISKLTLPNNGQERITVQGNPILDNYDCQLQWKDGGAVRKATALAEQIQSIMEKALSGDKKQGSPEKAHEFQPNDDIMEGNEPDSTGPENSETMTEAISAEDLEKPDE